VNVSLLLNVIWEFLNFTVPIKLPGEIELALWVWALIVGIVAGVIALVFRKIKKRLSEV
jgi:hypothetical protein